MNTNELKGTEDLVDLIACVCHEANRAYCQTLGDDSQKPWGEAPEWQRESVRKGVRLHIFNDSVPVAESHESWMKEKEETGWTYGPNKDEDKKTHPCMVPFDDLPVEHKAKDYIFRAIVMAICDYQEI